MVAESRVVLVIPHRALAYVEDHDEFVRGRALGRHRYEFALIDARRVADMIVSWAGVLESEGNPSADTRADIRALRAARPESGPLPVEGYDGDPFADFAIHQQDTDRAAR